MAKRVAGPNNEKPATIADHDPDCGGWALRQVEVAGMDDGSAFA